MFRRKRLPPGLEDARGVERGLEAARELAAYNIRVNAVCPGVIETEMTAALRQDEAMLRRWLEDIPQGRLGTVADVANAVLFFSSDKSNYITGQVLVVDGGMVM